jgi:uncharacterized protein involved in type VI secretion and phage assembly
MPDFFGKYRGVVIDNRDPLKLGRLAVLAPGISGEALKWAAPALPYAGPKVGAFFIPPVRAHVWVEFEAGNIDYPIWTGCFWTGQGGDDPPAETTEGEARDLKVLKTEKLTIVIDDKTVKLTVSLKTDSGDMKIEVDKKGILLTADQVTITLAPDRIELKKTPATIEVADAITLKKAAASVQVSDSVTVKNGAASIEVAASNIDIKNGAGTIAISPATVNINNGALEVM